MKRISSLLFATLIMCQGNPAIGDEIANPFFNEDVISAIKRQQDLVLTSRWLGTADGFSRIATSPSARAELRLKKSDEVTKMGGVCGMVNLLRTSPTFGDGRRSFVDSIQAFSVQAAIQTGLIEREIFAADLATAIAVRPVICACSQTIPPELVTACRTASAMLTP